MDHCIFKPTAVVVVFHRFTFVSYHMELWLIKSTSSCEMSSLLLGVGRGFRFGNMEPSWFYRLDALTITQPQCGIKSIPINPQYITPDIPDKIKTAAQKKTIGECFYIAQGSKMKTAVYIDFAKWSFNQRYRNMIFDYYDIFFDQVY